MLNVKVGTMPGRVNEFAFEEGTTVRKALEVAGLTTEGYQIKVNGVEEGLESTLSDGDLILLVKQIKGNAELVVKAGTMPGRINEFVVEPGTTVGQLVEIAGLETQGYQVKVNSEEADMGQLLNDGDLVLLVKQIKGNM